VRKKKAMLYQVGSSFKSALGLYGAFQRKNAALALKASDLLEEYGIQITKRAALRGLKSHGWQGRMERLSWRGRRVMLDGAHNVISVRALTREVRMRKLTDPWLVFGALEDKSSRAMLRVLGGAFRRVILTRAKSPRAKSVAALLDEARGIFCYTLVSENLEDALHLLRLEDSKSEIFMTGSFYLIGEAKSLLRSTHARN